MSAAAFQSNGKTAATAAPGVSTAAPPYADQIAAGGDSAGASAASNGSTSSLNEPIMMTASEYRAIIFLKEVIEKSGGSLPLVEIATHFGNTSDEIRATIGWTRARQGEFVRANSSIFVVSDDATHVSLVKNTKLNVIITGNKPPVAPPAVQAPSPLAPQQQPPVMAPPTAAMLPPIPPNTPSVKTGRGTIFHVAKLWGIIDLGKHEHVFFDKSIMRRSMDDLTKYFRPGEVLCFNAVLALKTSRAKWRATHVWKDVDPAHHVSGSESDLSNPDMAYGVNSVQLSPAMSVEEEINRFLPKRHEVTSAASSFSAHDVTNARSHNTSTSSNDGSDVMTSQSPVKRRSPKTGKFTDAAPSGAGVVPIYNFRRDSDNDAPTSDSVDARKSLTLVPESYQMSESSFRENIPATINNHKITSPTQAHVNGRTSQAGKYVEVACQTVSTGDVIATQLYYES